MPLSRMTSSSPAPLLPFLELVQDLYPHPLAQQYNHLRPDKPSSNSKALIRVLDGLDQALPSSTMHPLAYPLLSLLLSLLSLTSSITVLCTSNPNSTTSPALIAWLTLSAALVYISLCILLFTWLRLRKKWNGSQENFEKLPTGSDGKAWGFKCDSRSSSEISAGRERSQGTFYWCGESLRRVVRGMLCSAPFCGSHLR